MRLQSLCLQSWSFDISVAKVITVSSMSHRSFPSPCCDIIQCFCDLTNRVLLLKLQMKLSTMKGHTSSQSLKVSNVTSGFVGEPGLLPDGTIVDTARLPEGSHPEQPIAMSSERLLQSLQAGLTPPTRSAQSGTLLSTAQLQRMEQVMLTSDPLEVEAAALSRLQRNLSESGGHVVQYHPIALSDSNFLDSMGGIPGKSAVIQSSSTSSHALTTTSGLNQHILLTALLFHVLKFDTDVLNSLAIQTRHCMLISNVTSFLDRTNIECMWVGLGWVGYGYGYGYIPDCRSSPLLFTRSLL